MEFQTISVRQFSEYRKRPDTWIIDLRSKEEFEEVHVEGARNIPFENLKMYQKYQKELHMGVRRHDNRACILLL